MKQINYVVVVLVVMLTSCKTQAPISSEATPKIIKANINQVIDNWHKAAAEANFDTYFSLMTKDGVFIGTDATENWQNDDFKAFSKPYFDKGKAWSFTALERHVYLSEDKKMAWFDELLETQMKLCRGSGVLKLENNKWKIAHYVLSITIPNENVKQVIELKKDFDNRLSKTLNN